VTAQPGDPYYFSPPQVTSTRAARRDYRSPAPPFVSAEPGPPLARAAPRLRARLLDRGIVALISIPVTLPLFLRYAHYLVAKMTTAAVAVQNGQPVHPIFYDVATVQLILKIALVFVVVSFLYEVPQLALSGQTIGKRVWGVRVVRRTDLGPVGTGPAVARWAVQFGVSTVPWLGNGFFLLDSLWLLWDRRRQCLHDKVAGTLVLSVPGRKSDRAG
jgi:uncharacterized RDD family membrane protein YckC